MDNLAELLEQIDKLEEHGDEHVLAAESPMVCR